MYKNVLVPSSSRRRYTIHYMNLTRVIHVAEAHFAIFNYRTLMSDVGQAVHAKTIHNFRNNYYYGGI